MPNRARRLLLSSSLPLLVLSLGLAAPGCRDDESSGGDLVACTTNADCDGAFGAIGLCQSAVCAESGACMLLTARGGEACDDGSACTTGDACAEGQCVGEAIACDDGNVCTKDECDPTTGCFVALITGTTCDDADACTEGDLCSAGGCVPGQRTAGCCARDADCADTDPCTLDFCVDGTCDHLASNGSCDDGQACTTFDRCIDGQCSGTPIVCADDDPCTVDSCDPETGACGAVGAEDGATCDDLNPCTSGEEEARGHEPCDTTTTTRSTGRASSPCRPPWRTATRTRRTEPAPTAASS